MVFQDIFVLIRLGWCLLPKVADKIVNIRIAFKKITMSLSLDIFSRLFIDKNIFINVLLVWENIVDIWVETFLIFLIFFFVVHWRDVAYIFEEVLSVEGIAEKLRPLLCLVWRALASAYLFVSFVTFLKDGSSVSDDHHGVDEFPASFACVIEF